MRGVAGLGVRDTHEKNGAAHGRRCLQQTDRTCHAVPPLKDTPTVSESCRVGPTRSHEPGTLVAEDIQTSKEWGEISCLIVDDETRQHGGHGHCQALAVRLR